MSLMSNSMKAILMPHVPNKNNNRHVSSQSPSIRTQSKPNPNHFNNTKDRRLQNSMSMNSNDFKKLSNRIIPLPHTNYIKLQGNSTINQKLQRNNHTPGDLIITSKQQDNNNFHRINNYSKKDANNNIPRKSPIPIIRSTNDNNLCQTFKTRYINDKRELQAQLSKTFYKQKQLFNSSTAQDKRLSSPVLKENNHFVKLSPQLMKARPTSKSPIVGRPTLLDRFKKFHISDNNIGIQSFAKASAPKITKVENKNVHIYKLSPKTNMSCISNPDEKKRPLISLRELVSFNYNDNTYTTKEQPNVKKDNRQMSQQISKLNSEASMVQKPLYSTNTMMDMNTEVIIKKIKDIQSFTHVGFNGEKDKPNNQDAWFIEKDFAGNQDHIYMAVCDGHGHEGHFVSSFIKSTLPAQMATNFISHNQSYTDINQIIKMTFLDVNRKLIENPKINSFYSGSTCVSVFYTPEKLICANIGDSRAVIGRCVNGCWQSKNISRDHKPTEIDEAKRIIRYEGRIQPYISEGDYVGPLRVWIKEENIPGLAMTRSFGDRVASTAGVISDPEILHYTFTEDDKFMVIASDGVWEFIQSIECVKIIKDYYLKNDIQGCCENLYSKSRKRWELEERLVDDITMIIVFFK